MGIEKEEIQSYCEQRHVFIDPSQRSAERRTWAVIALTAVMMVVEIASGMLFGSMALLADGWHMASHVSALSITAVAYLLARRHAANPVFSFGTGKVGDLAGFSSALLLGLIALVMAYESIERFVSPVDISFREAILVAVVGFVVNLVSAFILRDDHDHDHNHGHDHDHNHASGDRDHNIKAAYMHVLADALTSVAAVVALITGSYLGWNFMDPLMGLVGALVISRWAYGLLKETGAVLLDMNPDRELLDRVRDALEEDGTRVADLHVWRLAPGHHAAVAAIHCRAARSPQYYKDLLCRFSGITHVTVEVNHEPEME